MLFNLLQFKGKADTGASANNGSTRIDNSLRMPQASDSFLNQEQVNLLQEYSSLGVLKGKIEKLLGVVKEESFLLAKKELGFEVKDDPVNKTKKERIKLEQELSEICKSEGIDFEQTLGKRLRTFSDRFQEKTKEILTERIEDQLAKRSFYEKLSAWGMTAFRSYLKVEEIALQAISGIKERAVVFAKEYFVNKKSFNEANERGITAAANSILTIRNFYQDKYQDSFWGDDKKFAGTGDMQAVIKLIPISPLSDLVFGSAIGLIDLTFKDELGNFVYNSWNNVAVALNYEEARITNRKEFIRWWGHGVEVIEVLGAAALIASSGGAAGIGLAEKAFRVSKYLGSSGTISFLSAVSQEWVDEKPDDYFRALENAGTNMGSSALFVFGFSQFSKMSSVDKAASLNNQLLTKAKISGITAKAVDLLDDGGDILEAGEQLAQTGLGTSDKEQGALLGMGVALFSARDTNPNKLNALLPAETALLFLPEVATKSSRKVSCILEIESEKVEVLRSPDGKRYYMEEGLIRKKYYEDRMSELIEYNQKQSISSMMDLLTLEQIAREESERKIAYTDERNGVCYLPMVTDRMRETLSAEELSLKQIYYRSVEIHEVEELRKLKDVVFADQNNAIGIEQRIETEENPYTMQSDFLNRWTDYRLSFQGGVQNLSRAGFGLPAVGSSAFANYIRNSYSDIPTKLAAAQGLFKKALKDFPLAVQKEIVKKAIDKYFLLYLGRDPNAPHLHRLIIENFYNKLKKPDFKQIQDPNFLANRLFWIFGRNPDTRALIQQTTEHLIECISSECEIFSAREYYQQEGEASLISSLGNDQILNSGLPIIIDYGAGYCNFSIKLHQNNPQAIILAIEPTLCIPKGEYDNLLQNHPRIIHYVGQGEDLGDSRVRRKARTIYLLFPMPNLFVQGVLPKFITDFLAPGGEVVLVSDAGNKGYHPERIDICDIPFAQFTASIIEEKSLLTEIRRLGSALLPPSLHSTFYQINFLDSTKHLVLTGGEYASSVQTLDSKDLPHLRQQAESTAEIFEDLGEVVNLYLDVARIENIEECQRVKVDLPSTLTNKTEVSLLTNQKGEEKLVVSSFAKNNSKIMDVIFRKRNDSWEVFYNRAPGHTPEVERKAFEDALKLFSELSRKDPRFKTSTFSIEVDWKRLGVTSTDQSTIDPAVQRLLQTTEFVSLQGWQYQGYRITNDDLREATGVFLNFKLKDTSQSVATPTAPTAVPEIKDFENRFNDIYEIAGVIEELSALTAEQVAFYIKNAHVQRLVGIIFANEGWGISFQRKVADFLIKFPTLANDLRATIEKNISKITDQLLEHKIKVLLNVIPAQGNPNIVELREQNLAPRVRETDITSRDRIEALSSEIDEKWGDRAARLAPFSDLEVKKLEDFSETDRAEILRTVSVIILQGIYFYNNIAYDIEELTAAVTAKFASRNFIDMEPVEILSMALSTQDEFKDLIPTAYLKLFTFSVGQQCSLFTAREYYGTELLEQNLQRLTTEDRDVIIDVGACEYDFTKKLLRDNRNSKIIAIEPLIRIGKDKFAELLESNPNLICHIGLARDLTDHKFNQIAKLIYILFPMPALMDTGEYQLSIFQLLAPGGEVILVTELANSNLDPISTGLISEFTAFFNIEEEFIVERRKVNCQLLPTSLRSSFYNDSFANPNRHFVHLDSNGSGMWTEMSEPMLELVASGHVPGYKLVKDGGRVGDLFLEVIKIKSVEGWESEKIDLPSSFTGQADLIKSGDEEILVVTCFDESKTKKEDFVFRKDNNSWTIFCDSTEKIKGKDFKDALALFTDLSKKDKRFKTKTLAIELDWSSLGIRSTEKTVVDAAVQSLLQKENLGSLAGNWQYLDYQTTNSDPNESTGIFLRFESLTFKFWEAVVNERAAFISDIENLARELKVALTTEQASTMFNSPEFEKLSIDFFEGNITPTQYLEELKKKFQAIGINPDNLELFLRLTIQSFANRFIALSSVVCVPYAHEIFYKEYLMRVYQTSLEIRDKKVGCMFTKPSLISGKFFFMPVTMANKQKCVEIGYRNFIDHSELEVLYFLPEENPSEHIQAGEVVWDLYKKIIKSSFERLRQDLSGKNELTLGSNTLFSILTRKDMTWSDLEQILSLQTVKKYLCEMLPTDQHIGIVPQYFDPSLDCLDQLIIISMSPTYQDCAPNIRHPRWASHLGISVNRQREFNKLAAGNIAATKATMLAWYQKTVGFKYSQGVFIQQNPLAEGPDGDSYRESFLLSLVEEVLTRIPQVLPKTIMGNPEFVEERNKDVSDRVRFRRF